MYIQNVYIHKHIYTIVNDVLDNLNRKRSMIRKQQHEISRNPGFALKLVVTKNTNRIGSTVISNEVATFGNWCNTCWTKGRGNTVEPKQYVYHL